MSDQTYNVRYNIEVESADATKQLGNFTQAVQALSRFGGRDMSEAIGNVTKAIASVDKMFKADKDGKKRSYNYSFNIDTKSGKAKLNRILGIVEQIEAKSKGIRLVVNPGKALDTKAIQKNAEQVISQSRTILGNLTGQTHTTQTSLTRSIGKINSALTHLERGRELNIKTDAAKARLSEILGMLGQIGTATARGMNLGVASGARNAISRTGVPYQPRVVVRTSGHLFFMF